MKLAFLKDWPYAPLRFEVGWMAFRKQGVCDSAVLS